MYRNSTSSVKPGPHTSSSLQQSKEQILAIYGSETPRGCSLIDSCKSPGGKGRTRIMVYKAPARHMGALRTGTKVASSLVASLERATSLIGPDSISADASRAVDQNRNITG